MLMIGGWIKASQASRIRNSFFIAPWRKDALRGFFQSSIDNNCKE